jgi:hypothetical protein
LFLPLPLIFLRLTVCIRTAFSSESPRPYTTVANPRSYLL